MGPQINKFAGRQISSSNETLNMFLGGRQPAWMTSAPISPGSNVSRPQKEAQPQHDQGTRKASKHRDAPSTSTSPSLANTMPPPPHQSPGLTTSNPLPSPSLTDSDSNSNPNIAARTTGCTEPAWHGSSTDALSRKRPLVTAPPESSKRARVQNDRPVPRPSSLRQYAAPNRSLSLGSSSTSPEGHTENHTLGTRVELRQSDPQTNSHTPTGELPREHGEARPTQPFSSEFSTNGLSIAHEQLRRNSGGHTSASNDMIRPSTLTSAATVLGDGSGIVSPDTTLGQPSLRIIGEPSFSPPQQRPQVHNLNVPSPNNTTSSAHPPAYRVANTQGRHVQEHTSAVPVPAPSPYYSEVSQPLFEEYLRRRGGRQSLSPFGELRMRVLKSAVDANDFYFLFVHQVVCLQSSSPQDVPQMIRNLPQFGDAIRIVNNILASDDLNDCELLAWFSDFPAPLKDVALEWSRTYQNGVGYLKHLFTLLARHWADFQNQCRQRGSPPLVSELIYHLGIQSPVLMETFFTAALRTTWPGESASVYASANGIFFHDRDSCLSRPLSATMDDRIQSDNIYTQSYTNLQRYLTLSRPQPTPPIVQQRPNLNHPTGAMPQQPRAISSNMAPAMHRLPRYGSLNVTHPSAPASMPPVGTLQAQPISSLPSSVLRPSPQNRLLIPPAGADRPPQPANPTWQTSALHQAHLRNPVLANTHQFMKTDAKPILYQFLTGFALPPKRLEIGLLAYEWTFLVSEGEKELIPITVPSLSGKPPTRVLREGCQQYRVRCSKVGAVGEETIQEKNWVLCDTSYPDYVYLRINSKLLEIRTKQHYGKDLPIDITEFVVAGDNKLQIYLNTSRKSKDPASYAFAVEVVGVKSHDSILQDCGSRLQSASEVLSSIQKCLAGDPSDDDLVMVSANLSIDLFDPISLSDMCSLPVRGERCLHRSCFDLGAFLQSRSREKPNWPTLVDVWRCPICREDVRPQCLVLDGFLLDVKEKLTMAGLATTRGIVVEQNGAWRPKAENASNDSRKTNFQLSKQDRTLRHSSTASPAQKATESPTLPVRSPTSRQIVELSARQEPSYSATNGATPCITSQHIHDGTQDSSLLASRSLQGPQRQAVVIDLGSGSESD